MSTYFIHNGKCRGFGVRRPYKINSINEYNISHRENDAGNHAVCQLGNPGRSVHFKNNNCHTDLSPSMESAMYGFYRLIAPSSVTPSFFMRIERLPIKKPSRSELMAEWNEVERGDKTLETFINNHADKQVGLFAPIYQNFILQGSRTAEGMRFDQFLTEVGQGKNSYKVINRESFSYHILLSLLFNPSDYKADNLFLSPQGHIVGIDNDGCLAHPIIWKETTEFLEKQGRTVPLQTRTYHVGVKNVLYLLPLMEETIHENVIKAFKNINVPLTLLRWISFLDAQDKRYKPTFNLQGLERPIESSHSFPVRLVSGTMMSLYERLRALQSILSDSWGITHQQLLMRSQSLVGKGYQAHVKRDPNPLSAMSTIYDRTLDLQILLPNCIDDLQLTAHNKDAYTLNRKASLEQEIQAVLPKLQEDDKHLAQILDYLVRYLPSYAHHLSLKQDPKRFQRMLNGGASIRSLRWLLEHKKNTTTALQWEPGDLIAYAKTFMLQTPKNHLEGHLNPILSFLLNHFEEWADELLPILPDNAWQQVIQEQTQHQAYNTKVLDYLHKRDPKGLNRLDANHKMPLDIAFDNLNANNVNMAIDLINKGAWQVSLSGRGYRDLRNNKDQFPASFWQAFTTLQERNAKVGWTVTLEELFPITQKQGQNVIQGTSGESRLLTKTILKQLTDHHREIKEGRHKVIQVAANGCFAYLKFYPELVGLEEAVGELTRRTIGFGVPHGELFRFPDGTPVWVSQGIPGKTLQWVLTHDPNRLNHLDPVSVTNFILMAMLTNPEDGKPDNYIVEPLPDNPNLYRLSSPDNDHGFVPAFVKTKPDKGNLFKKPELVVQVKTILYCLDLMNQPIPEETKALFLKNDPLDLLQDWLDVLDRRNRRYEALYSSTEAAALFKDHECFMGIPFQKGMISQLYSKWARLRDCLGAQSFTPLQLLSKVEARLANRYREAFEDPKNKTVWDRFEQVDGDFYHQKGDHWRTLTPSNSILTSQNILVQESTLEAIRNGKELGPKQAMTELREIVDQKKQSELSLEHMITDAQREAFLNEFDFAPYPISKQHQIINQLISQGAGWRNLTLKNCAIIEDSALQKSFLAKDMVRLDLNGCQKITHDIMPLLSQMPGLEMLNLSNLPKLRWLANAGVFSYDSIQLLQLHTLNLNNCSNLKIVDIDAPYLTHMWAKGAARLQSLKIKSNMDDEIFYRLIQNIEAPILTLGNINVADCGSIAPTTKKKLLIEAQKKLVDFKKERLLKDTQLKVISSKLNDSTSVSKTPKY